MASLWQPRTTFLFVAEIEITVPTEFGFGAGRTPKKPPPKNPAALLRRSPIVNFKKDVL